MPVRLRSIRPYVTDEKSSAALVVASAELTCTTATSSSVDVVMVVIGSSRPSAARKMRSLRGGSPLVLSRVQCRAVRTAPPRTRNPDPTWTSPLSSSATTATTRSRSSPLAIDLPAELRLAAAGGLRRTEVLIGRTRRGDAEVLGQRAVRPGPERSEFEGQGLCGDRLPVSAEFQDLPTDLAVDILGHDHLEGQLDRVETEHHRLAGSHHLRGGQLGPQRIDRLRQPAQRIRHETLPYLPVPPADPNGQ